MAFERHEKRIAATLEEATLARGWLRQRLESLAGVEREIVSDLLLVFGELVTNSVRHAYPQGTRGPIDIGVTLSNDWLEITVRDFGKTMDRGAYRSPDLSAAHEGGYGIHLVRQLTDELAIDSPGGRGNRFVARRRLSSKSRRSAAMPGAGVGEA